ncbi:MAG: hypothetical protein RJA70_2975 [Pseudomonadota bacterium]|jgi:hypothetical protein
MILSGLSLTTLLGIFGAMAAATLAFYILRLRRRAVSVPFSPIWQRVLKDKEATHWFSQLKRWLSLLLQLLIVLLLVFALGDPRLSDKWFEGRNIVVLVDTSASMAASDVQPSRIEVGKKQLTDLVNSLSGTDRMLIAEMGAAPRAVSTMTSDTAELTRASQSIRTKDTRADFERGIRFALDSLRGLPKAEIVVISDGAAHQGDELSARFLGDPALEHVTLRQLPVGSGGKNVAVTAFSVRRYPLDKSRYEVLLEVTNFQPEAAVVEITLIGDGETVDVTRLSLEPNERMPRSYHDLSGASRTLEARVALVGSEPVQPGVEPGAPVVVDQLSKDDSGYALMPERRRVRVLLVTAGNRYIEAALLLDEYLDVTVITPSDALPRAEFDVSILDGVAPELRASHGARLYLNPPPGVPLAHKSPQPILDFGFDSWDRKSPFLRWAAMGNVQVAKGFAFKPETADHVEGESDQGPILVSGKRDGQRFLATGFDPRDSDFVLRVGWPLFLLNAINTFASEDTSYISSYRTGEVWNVPVPSGLNQVSLRTPSGLEETVPVKDGNAVYFGEYAGFYELRGPGGEVLSAFAANLIDAEESQLKPAEELVVGHKTAEKVTVSSTGVRLEVWLYLLLAACAISAIEWFTYHRRVTV